MPFDVTVRKNDVIFTADNDAVVMAAWHSIFAVMTEGDVIDSASIRANKLFYRDMNPSPVTVSKGGSLFLGFETEVFQPGVGDVAGYGLVKFTVDSLGHLDPFETAIDLDGGPMIVGGGSAIPEPHSGLLLLVGGALLALRRRDLLYYSSCKADKE